MSFRVLTAAEIERLLPMSECIELVAGVFVALERGEMTMPLRSTSREPVVARN